MHNIIGWTDGTNTTVLAVVQDLGERDGDADDDADDDKNERTGERRYVNTARFVDVQRRVHVSYQPLRGSHVPTLTAVCEPATPQCL